MFLRDLFCELCKLQFDKKVVYEMHQSVVHGKSLKIKEEQSDYADNKIKEIFDPKLGARNSYPQRP